VTGPGPITPEETGRGIKLRGVAAGACRM
jgi:hypothetical protein